MPEGSSLYSSLEEKYYSVVEKLGPIEGIVEKIDRVFPSFLLLIMLVIAIAGYLILPMLLQATSAQLQLRLINSAGEAVQGSAQLDFAGKTQTLQADNAGTVKTAVTKDTNVSFFAKANGYSPLKGSVFVRKENVSLDIVLQEKQKTFDRKIIFTLESGELIKGKAITAKIACSNSTVKPENEIVSSNELGEIGFVEPANCGTLTLTVTGPAEFKQKSTVITDQLTVVALEYESLEKGTADLMLVDESGALLENLGANVSLVKNGFEAQQFQIEHGHGMLEALPGHYQLLVQDNSQQYAMPETIEFDLNAGQRIAIEVKMSREMKGSVFGKVSDMNSGSAIENASVELRGLLGNLLASVKTEKNGEFSLPVAQSAFLTLSVSAGGYLPFEESVETGKETKIIKLEKATALNSGKIRVHVFDANSPAANAVVTLHYADSWLAAPYGQKITDANGTAEFSAVIAGEYVVFVEKYPYSAQSGALEIISGRETELPIWLSVQETSVFLKAVDEKGNYIAGTKAKVFDAADGKMLDTIEMQSGTGFYTSPSDKRVFFVFSNPDYLPYYTETLNLATTDFVTVRARMPKQIEGEAPKAELIGIFNEFGEMVLDLETGKDYSARIELLVPQSRAFDAAGLHFRVGSEKSTESDELQIAVANAGTASVLSGKSFNEPKSESVDLAAENTNVFPAKWINATIENPEAGVYAVELKLRVSDKAKLNSLLPLFYRAWGEENRAYYRSPEDKELGQATETSEKQAQYAKTTASRQYFRRSERTCYGSICLIVNVQNAESAGFLEEPYELFLGADYNVFFTIINSSSNARENISFYVSNSSGGKKKEDLKISGFGIESQPKEFSDFETSAAQISIIGPQESVYGTVSVSPLKGNYTALQFHLKSQDYNEYVFTAYFDIFEKRFMKISSLPEKPVALSENKITFFAADPGTGKGIKDTLFKLSMFGYDYSESYLQKKSDSNGAAEFILPAMKPGSILLVEAFSPNFFSRPLVLEFAGAPLYFSPTRAFVAIDTSESLEKKGTFRVVNAISQSVNVESVGLYLEQPAFFEEDAMKEFLKQFPREFAAFSEEEKELLLVRIRENVFIPKDSRFKGALLVNAKSGGIEWVFALPFEALVDSENVFAGENSCIGVKEDDWAADLQKNIFYKTISLKNNCMSGEEEINVYDLRAAVGWDSEKMGNFEIAALDSAGKETATAAALAEDSPVFLGELPAGAEKKIILRFVPKNGYWGQTASFTVGFSAISPGKKSDAEILSEKKISASIMLFSPLSCVRIAPNPAEKIKIGELDRNASFEIDASSCGDNKIQFTMCQGNADCSGGTEGGIIVSPEIFVSAKSNPKKKIIVIRQEIPGEYGINISARVGDVTFRDFAEMLVEIQPKNNEQVFLDKYSFYLNGEASMDSAAITNRKLAEMVKVEASVCDWRDMLKYEERHFNFKDAGSGLREKELSGSREFFSEAMATSNAIALVDSNSIVAAAEAAQLAYEKAKIASEDAKAAVDQTQKTLELAQNLGMAISAVQIMISVTEMLNHNTVEGACNGYGKDAKAWLIGVSVAGSALNILIGMIETDLQKMLEKMNTGYGALDNSLSKTESMKENSEEGKKQMMPADSSEISYSSKIASSYFNTARETGKEAASKNKGGENTLEESQKMAEEVIAKELGKGYLQAGNIRTTNDAYFGILKISIAECEADTETCNEGGKCSIAYAKAESFGKASVDVQLAQIITQFAVTSKALEEAKSLIQKAIASADDAREAELDAEIKLRRAISVSQSISEASFKTAEAQSTDSNTVNKIVSLYPFIGFIGGEFSSGIYSELENPCDYKIRGSLIGYITDLRSDTVSLDLNIDDIGVSMNRQEAKVFGDYNSQTLGIVLQNNGFKGKKPAYGTLSIKYKKHLHDFIQDVPLGYMDFGPFRVPDYETETIEQKFHVRVIPSQQEQAVLADKNSESCMQGIKSGITGAGALPKIKLDWGWSNEKGISQNGCEETSPDYYYCDAAQFNIMLSKKLNALDEWLSANNGRLECPKNSVEGAAKNVIEKLSRRVPEAGSIGIEKIAANVRGNNVAVIATVKNGSGEEKNANIVFSIIAPKGALLDGNESVCKKSQKIPAGATAGIDCTFSGLPESNGFYAAKSYLQPNDSYYVSDSSVEFNDEQNIDLNSSLSVAFRTGEDTAEKQCWLEKTTDLLEGKSALEYFARDSAVKWTAKVKNNTDLAGLLHFKAFLEEDNYNKSFSSDFADYYSSVRFFDTPTFFSDEKTEKTLNKYYSGGKILFNNRYFDSTKLPGAGLFSVDINSYFGEEWEMFGQNGKPAAVIKPVFSKIAEPFPLSPFYYMPFDSGVGIKNNSLEREGYGSAYKTEGSAISLNETEFDKMPESAGSNALKKISAVFSQEIGMINASPVTRGNILSAKVFDSNGGAQIVFSPNYASPAIMRMTMEKPKFSASAVYQLMKSENVYDAGNSLAYWTGMGSCYGFSGNLAKKDFDYSSDRRATASDLEAEWKNSYALGIGKADNAGNLLLKTIIFTPVEGSFNLKAISKNVKVGGTEKFFGEIKELRGIKGMEFNSRQASDYTETIKDAFSAVANKSACISNNGIETGIWWNEKALEKQAEDAGSIETTEKSLEPGKDCIGK